MLRRLAGRHLKDPDGRNASARVSLQVHFFVFEAAPQPFDENVVAETAASVHADGDAVAALTSREGIAGELGALIGVNGDFLFVA